MTPEAHDASLARTSHVPHIAAAALARLPSLDEFPLAGGAFRDTTRVAASGAELWTQIFLENHSSVQAALEEYMKSLADFRGHLEARDFQAIAQWWNTGRRNRLLFNGGEDPSPPD
jgi:prephenate dehydrogenase